MWARVVETMLGIWLAISPLVFRRATAPAALWWTDLAAAAAVITLALASYWQPTRHAHFAILLVAGWLVVSAFLSEYPTPPAEQNHLLTGLLLIMLAIIPNRASQAPRSWAKFARDIEQAR
jgi:hypothetical protein